MRSEMTKSTRIYCDFTGWVRCCAALCAGCAVRSSIRTADTPSIIGGSTMPARQSAPAWCSDARAPQSIQIYIHTQTMPPSSIACLHDLMRDATRCTTHRGWRQASQRPCGAKACAPPPPWRQERRRGLRRLPQARGERHALRWRRRRRLEKSVAGCRF